MLEYRIAARRIDAEGSRALTFFMGDLTSISVRTPTRAWRERISPGAIKQMPRVHKARREFAFTGHGANPTPPAPHDPHAIPPT